MAEKWGNECGGRCTVHHAIGVQFRGMGQKASDYDTIPLCENHHQCSRNAIHSMGMKPWEKRYGPQRDLIERVKELLNDG